MDGLAGEANRVPIPCPEGRVLEGEIASVFQRDGLTAEDFPCFFKTITGHSPYPWQERLLQEVQQEGWPQVVAVPTGAGKTMTLLLAVFRMALEPCCAHRRVVYVVNRRLVVDQALELALDLKGRLEGALEEDSCLGRVARRLAALGSGVPIEVIRLRGGVPKPTPSLTDPARPAVILATVDMAGSRLLHRGYGVSRGLLPLEAALFGVDALFLLDEAHLEAPFWHTLQQVMGATKGSPRPSLVAVALTATPQALQGQGRVFTLDQHDQTHPGLVKRLGASKHVRFERVKEEELSQALVDHALHLGKKLKGPVAVVSNRVMRALEVYRSLKKTYGEGVLLLTGRMRPYERDLRFSRTRDLQDQMDQGTVRFVVATQALEVGADLDFKGMVTELADLSAILQRLGRVNRRGAHQISEVVILSWKPEKQRDQKRPAKAFPYTQESLEETERWLGRVLGGPGQQEGEMAADFSPTALSQHFRTSPPPPKAFAPGRQPVPLWEEVFTALAHTDPLIPLDPAPYLHGVGRGIPEVEVVWRGDFPQLKGNAKDLALAQEYLENAPPQPRESVRLPLFAFRNWLQGLVADFPDVEGGEGAPGENQDKGFGGNGGKALGPREDRSFFLRWDGETVEVLRLAKDSLKRIRPGDTVVIPSQWGGLAGGHWDPSSPEPVPDVAEHAQEQPRFLRLHPATLAEVLGPDGAEAFLEELWASLDPNAGSREVRNAIKDLLNQHRHNFPSGWQRLLKDVSQGKFEVWPWPPERDVYQGLVLRLRPQHPLLGVGGPEPLVVHLEKVAAELEGFLSRLCLKNLSEADALYKAAWWHDLGKLDSRMQEWMWLSLPFQVNPSMLPLGKSGSRLSPKDLERLRRQAGYPKGQRHEHVVVAPLLRNAPSLEAHLIATHHGRGRPLPEASRDRENWEIEVNMPGPVGWQGPQVIFSQHQLESLKNRYLENFSVWLRKRGPWGLAYLEALLRLADFKASGG